MHDPADLLNSASWVRSADNADGVRRALRAHLLGLQLSDGERGALTFGAQLLDRTLKVVSARTPQEQASASFSADPDVLRLLTETVSGISLRRTTVENLRNGLTGLAAGHHVEKELLQEAVELFAQLTRVSLDRLRTLQELPGTTEFEEL
jgi:hypothetical protein